jgi:hypothetical protein
MASSESRGRHEEDKIRFPDERWGRSTREADQRPVPDVAKKHWVSAQTTYAWRKHFGSFRGCIKTPTGDSWGHHAQRIGSQYGVTQDQVKAGEPQTNRTDGRPMRSPIGLQPCEK